MDIDLASDPARPYRLPVKNDLAGRVGPRAAKRLVAFAERARAASPVPVLQVILFGSRARGNAGRDSDWDVAVVVHDKEGGDSRATRRCALNVFAALALPEIAEGFHLRPIVIGSVETTPDPEAWQVSPALAHNISADGVLIG